MTTLEINRISAPKPAEGMLSVRRELDGLKFGLTFIDRFIVDRRINREAKRIIADGCVQFLEAKRQELIHQLTLGLSEAKKRRLVESMRVSAEIDQEISSLSAEFTATLLDSAFAGYVTAAKAEVKKLQDLEEMHGRKQITDTSYRELREAATGTKDHLVAITKEIAAQIVLGHVERVRLALENFKARQLPTI